MDFLFKSLVGNKFRVQKKLPHQIENNKSMGGTSVQTFNRVVVTRYTYWNFFSSLLIGRKSFFFSKMN